jgi:hypothetical protein
MDLFKQIMNWVQDILKYPPVVTIVTLVLYIGYTQGNSFFNSVEPWLAVASGLLLGTFFLNILNRKYKLYFAISCLVASVLFYVLIMALGYSTFYADNGPDKIHYRGFTYTKEAALWVKSPESTEIPAEIVAKFGYVDEKVWSDVWLAKALLITLNSLICGALFFAIQLEQKVKKDKKKEKDADPAPAE